VRQRVLVSLSRSFLVVTINVVSYGLATNYKTGDVLPIGRTPLSPLVNAPIPRPDSISLQIRPKVVVAVQHDLKLHSSGAEVFIHLLFSRNIYV
jgi:hypothetical protein